MLRLRGGTTSVESETAETGAAPAADPDENEEALKEQLGAAMKKIASEKRRRAQGAEEVRPKRGERVSWRRALRVYVTPSVARDHVDSWLVTRDHFDE